MMTQISSEIRINAPKEKVWAIIADLGAVQNFHPGVQKSYYSSENQKGLGTSRVCELPNGWAIEERATEWQEGEGFVLESKPLKKSPRFKKAYGRWALKQDAHQTLVTLIVEYTLKFGPFGSLIDALMVRPQFKKIVPRVLAGLKHYAETNEEITPEFLRKVMLAALVRLYYCLRRCPLHHQGAELGWTSGSVVP